MAVFVIYSYCMYEVMIAIPMQRLIAMKAKMSPRDIPKLIYIHMSLNIPEVSIRQ